MNLQFPLSLSKGSRACIGLALVLLLLVLPGVAAAQEPSEDYELLWSYETGGCVWEVSVAADGCCIAAGCDDHKVYLLDPEGKLLWSYETAGSVHAVSVAADGSHVVAGSWENSEAYFFNREGKLLWSYETAGSVRAVSATADGSFVAVGSGDGKVYFFSREGELLWSYQTDASVRTVSVSENGSYIAAGSAQIFTIFGSTLGSHKVYSFNRQGELLWSYETPGNVCRLSVSEDGSFIAVGSVYGEVYLFSHDGSVLWSHDAGGALYGVSISADGSFIALGSSGHDNKVYFFNKEGKLIWDYQASGNVDHVSVSADGSYIAARSRDKDGRIYLFDSSGTPLWSYETGGYEGGVSVAADGSYIVGSGNKKIYFFVSSSILRSLLSDVQNLIHKVETKGFKMAKAADLLSQAEQVFEAGDYKKANELAEQAKSLVSQTVQEGTVAKDAIGIAKASIEQEKSNGFKLAEAENLLSQAEQVFEAGDYKKANELAEQAKNLVPEITKEATLVKDSIDAAKSSIAQEKSKGFNVLGAEGLLSRMEEAFEAGDYQNSHRLALEAEKLALDIDGDSVANEKDFAPAINNNYIYAGGAVFVVGVIGSVSAIRRRKQRAKQAIEKEKAEIIALIDDALKGE